MELTPSQRQALATDRHLAITANAGSGKTRVLVRRYVDFFLHFPTLTTRNVAAITFTENAANELRERITKEIQDRLDESATTSEQRDRLRELRDSLRSAFIGTIHGFASRILREYPVEANVDAGFTIVTGAEERLLREDVMGRVFYSTLEEAYARPEENLILHLFRTIGRRQVGELVRALMNNRQRARRIQKSLLEKNDDDVIQFCAATIEMALSIVFASETQALLHDARSYIKPSSEGTDCATAIESYFRSGGLIETTTTFAQLLAVLLTKDGTIRKRTLDEKLFSSEFAERMQAWLPRVHSIQSLLECLPSTQNEFYGQLYEYLRLMRAAFELYDQTMIEYISAKSEFSLLDFDDLIEKLLQLLDDTNLRAEISKEFRFIMIDEYQDTDENQFQLARMLTKEFGTENNLVIVGDPKQSIYTFRNADEEVFHDTRNAMMRQSLNEMEADRPVQSNIPEQTGHIQLQESFRMTRAPLAVINLLFRELLNDPSRPYSELIHARNDSAPGSVDWICARKATPDKDSIEPDAIEDDDIGETDLIARHILQILRNPEGRYSIETSNERSHDRHEPNCGDIAILLRSRTSLPQLERSLARYGIPYTVSKGAGFFIQQEILDITNYLSFLTAPSDDIALVGILRSPFFSVSDVELFQISTVRQISRGIGNEFRCFWDSFQYYVAQKKSNYLTRILDQLKENLSIAGRISTAPLVEKIYRETGIFASLQTALQPEQKIANLQKFLDEARSSDSSGFSSIFDFVERICYLRDSEEQESQADIPTDSDAVRIMTVHAAKGLEFPIVILPFLQKKFNFTHRNILDKKLGLQISFRDGFPKSAIAEWIRLRSHAATVEEEKRILYVAMTRARDHLVLSCTMPAKIPDHSWLRWITNALGVPDSDNILIHETVIHYDSQTQVRNSEPISIDIPAIRFIPDSSVPSISEVKIPSNLPLYLTPLSAPVGGLRFSASQFMRLRDCATKYYLTYRIGMPDDGPVSTDSDDVHTDEYTEPETIHGPQLGRIVHALLERIGTLQCTGPIDEEPFQSIFDQLFHSLHFSDASKRTEYQQSAYRHVSYFLISPLAAQIRSSTSVQREYPIQMLLPSGNIVHGILDLLFLDSDGIWTVLDFKTNAVPDPEQYRFQMQCYAYLVSRMKSVDSVRAILFFTANGTMKEFHFTSENLSIFEKEMFELMEDMEKLGTVPDLQRLPRNKHHCPDCNFFQRPSNQCIVLKAQNPTATPAI